MATVTINNSPIHSQSSLSAVFGETGSSWARFHTGIDFIPSGGTPANPLLYSVCTGEVVEVNLTPSKSLGNNVVIKDSSDDTYWRYCHMMTGSVQSFVGQQINTGSIIGTMGATGNVTGIHLHLEHSTTIAWNYDTFLNPADALGIPNQRGTIVLYDGATPPTPPVPPQNIRKKKFPWFIIWARRRRNY